MQNPNQQSLILENGLTLQTLEIRMAMMVEGQEQFCIY